MAEIALLDYTGKGTDKPKEYAARLLAFTKNTRLAMTPDAYADWMVKKPWPEIDAELQYMATTIRSSWEFVDVTFLISDVSRACAQQITRTRTASYAMQSQRVTDVSSAGFHVPETVEVDKLDHYIGCMRAGMENYEDLLNTGVSMQDARGVLPMNVNCNLVAKYNLRNWIDLVAKRSSLRAQGEYVDVVRQMKSAVLSAMPWVSHFMTNPHDMSIQLIEEVAQGMELSADLKSGDRAKLAKAADLLKGQ